VTECVPINKKQDEVARKDLRIMVQGQNITKQNGSCHVLEMWKISELHKSFLNIIQQVKIFRMHTEEMEICILI
jgi:hypothetical protein